MMRPTINEESDCLRKKNLRRRQASEFGGHLRGKLIFGGVGEIEFLKRYCYLPMPLSQDVCPPPGDSPPSQKGAIFLGIPPPEDEYPRNIAPPREANAPGMSPSL